jgi:hypothetical protein
MKPLVKIGLVFFLFGACAGAVLFTFFLRPRGEPAKPADLYAVINNQIGALRADDFPRAYGHASNGLRQKLNPSQFEELIRADYPMTLRPARVEFGIAEQRGPRALIQVYFIGRESRVVPCIYSLVHEGLDWKIDGVRVAPRRPAAVQLRGVRS